MKKSKESVISIVLFCISAVLGCVSIVTGVMGDRVSGIATICMYLAFAFLGFGLLFYNKSKNNDGQAKHKMISVCEDEGKGIVTYG